MCLLIHRTKLYMTRSKTDMHGKKEKDLKFPMLDIFWIDNNETHVWVNTEDMTHKKSTVYPLTLRPFNGRMFPSPRDPRKALEEIYSEKVFGKCI